MRSKKSVSSVASIVLMISVLCTCSSARKESAVDPPEFTKKTPVSYEAFSDTASVQDPQSSDDLENALDRLTMQIVESMTEVGKKKSPSWNFPILKATLLNSANTSPKNSSLGSSQLRSLRL